MAMNSPRQTSQIKREILVRVIKAFMSDDFEENARLIPYDMRPGDGDETPYRCCIYKDRAVIRNRIIADLGASIEEAKDSDLLSNIAKKAIDRTVPEEHPLTVLTSACKGCHPSIYVTDLCQGCVARPCESICRFDAIHVIDGRSRIDQSKCKKCGMCMQVCPYQAIMRTIVPCESVCPTGAIAKDEHGHAVIDFDKCISCGKCASACPFAAIHEKSQIIDVLKILKEGKKKLIAMVAPAMMGQLPCKPAQVKEAIQELGFSDVYEVAQGADITTKNESKEFVERMERGDKFMTTSCCAGYNELVDRHIPELKPFRSDTKTPMYYTAEIVKHENPDAITVFFSPCVAKKCEASKNPNVDYVLNYEEIGAWMVANDIQVSECSESQFKNEASKEGRNYCVSGGVAGAVKALIPDGVDCNPVMIDGLTKQTVKDLKKYAKNGACELGNLIEVMACTGGCLGGNSTINAYRPALKQVTSYVNESKSIKEEVK